ILPIEIRQRYSQSLTTDHDRLADKMVITNTFKELSQQDGSSFIFSEIRQWCILWIGILRMTSCNFAGPTTHIYNGEDASFSATTLADAGKAVGSCTEKHPKETKSRRVYVSEVEPSQNRTFV
ncbi:hypothetical protein KEM54_002797, partial [Ascosphaera aggregata]